MTCFIDITTEWFCFVVVVVVGCWCVCLFFGYMYLGFNIFLIT